MEFIFPYQRSQDNSSAKAPNSGDSILWKVDIKTKPYIVSPGPESKVQVCAFWQFHGKPMPGSVPCDNGLGAPGLVKVSGQVLPSVFLWALLLSTPPTRFLSSIPWWWLALEHFCISYFTRGCDKIFDKKQLKGGKSYFPL